MTAYRELLRVLTDAGVEYVIVGGVAGVLHGSVRFTEDLDVVYARTDDNIQRLCTALVPHDPYPRGAPKGLPFTWDERTLRSGLNFTLDTKLGALDLFGEIAGGGDYSALAANVIAMDLDGLPVRCVDLPTLVRLKRAAGRPKDLEAIAELEALREERDADDASG